MAPGPVVAATPASAATRVLLEKLILAVLAATLAHLTTGRGRRLGQMVLLFRPETVLQWHRELARRKWTFARRRPAGGPPIAAELEALIMRLAGENPSWGSSRIHGELGTLGFTVGRSTVPNALTCAWDSLRFLASGGTGM